MLKKFFATFFLAAIIFVGQNNFAEAEDVWVGTSNATGWECYIMTETIRHMGDSDVNLATLKMVAKDNSVRKMEYRFWWDFGIERVCFSNSQGFNGIADAYETPIEWRMWQVIVNHNN